MKKIHEVCRPFWWPCGCAGAMRHTLPDRARPGLHREPLDVAIGLLFALYCPGKSTMVIEGGNTTNATTKNYSVTVHCAYAKLVKKDTKGTLYSSRSKWEFVEIAIDNKKAETIRNFSSYQTLKLDKNLLRISSPKKLKKSCRSWPPIAVKLLNGRRPINFHTTTNQK